ncbi:heme exporter protein CcmD [Uliginosibacterium paludis]|uniref:Heme exporter protein D n=1 Tax=Uliginosibacterium paludis TaxID=1615952 RepID=A0ABV2CPB7_9RHOO
MMYWQSLADFLSMGGRGFFVWGSYGVAFLLVVLEIWLLRRSRRQSLRRLQQLQALERD